MSFLDEVRQSLKTKEQVRDEAAKEKAERTRIDARLLYQRMKEEILQKAQHGEAVRGKISGVLTLEGWEYGLERIDPFRGGTFRVANLEKLDAVCAALRDMAAADGILVSEPFVYGTVRAGLRLVKTERFRRRFGSLSGEMREIRAKKGETYLYEVRPAIDYECRV